MPRSADDPAAALGDPLNRFYRYPVARALVRVAGRLPVTPDHVTVGHTVAGIAAAALVTSGAHPLLAFALLELRMILDCYDGVLARAKGLSSPRGRALDELGDAIAYVALVAGIAVRVHRAQPDYALGLAAALLAIGGFAAHAHDFYKRRLTSALRGAPDAVAAELEAKRALVAAGRADALTRFGVCFDAWQVRLFDARSAPERLRARAATRSVRALRVAVSLLAWDNALAILNVGVLFDRVLVASIAAIAFGAFMLLVTFVCAHRATLRREGAR